MGNVAVRVVARHFALCVAADSAVEIALFLAPPSPFRSTEGTLVVAADTVVAGTVVAVVETVVGTAAATAAVGRMVCARLHRAA